MQDYTILVNKEHLLSSDYVPENLVITDDNENNFHDYKDPNFKPMISADILPYFEAMQKAAEALGLRKIIVDSGYRPYEYQQVIFDKSVAEKGLEETLRLVSLPGSSEHQTGLAIDIAYMDNGVYIEKTSDVDPEIMWLKENAHKFGFILRYPEGKEDVTNIQYERWHYRFVGVEMATILYAEGITLDEYYERVEQENYSRGR
jgi:D-alanyl-D-alanine carboxypeptidase